MEFALTIVILLIVLAAIDLTVGVANDAVNFVNSALGSRAATFRIIMLVAGLGVLVGVTFSSGMMEVARKGIFNPEMFMLIELLIIFVAVMYQDILLLDFFNTYGLPTSTTVSIVFGLFGSGFAMSLIKINQAGQSFEMIFQYINAANVFKIVSAILLSIVFAFVFGSLIQYLTRMLFTFDFKDKFKKYGGLWGGLALSFLSYFILLKGIKGSTFLTGETGNYIQNNIWQLMLYIFIGWTIVLQLLISFTKFNVLRFIVLFGTFSLALAFAANDLVNFIGAPLAGLNAYQLAIQSSDPLTASMEALKQPIQANLWILLIAGLIMITTLFFSRKARSVAYTTIRLGRQEEGHEQFESNIVARIIVRGVIKFFHKINRFLPVTLREKVRGRFDLSKYKPDIDKDGNKPAFDLIRASVILVVAAALISFATSLKLPLSTTYVTFIVAMAAALPDKAWGRESAVYRVSGVVTVIAGWFFTALMASIIAMLIAFAIYYGEFISLAILTGLAAYVLISTTKTAKQKEEEYKLMELQIKKHGEDRDELITDLFNDIGESIRVAKTIISKSYSGLSSENVSKLKSTTKMAKKLDSQTIVLIKEIVRLMRYTSDEDIESTADYTRTLGTFQNINDRLMVITKQNFKYIADNQHELLKEQKEELEEISGIFDKIVESLTESIKSQDFDEVAKHEKKANEFKEFLSKIYKKQLKRIKKSENKIKRSILYLNVITDLDMFTDDMLRVYATCQVVHMKLYPGKYDKHTNK